jgi:hypothetical protein
MLVFTFELSQIKGLSTHWHVREFGRGVVARERFMAVSYFTALMQPKEWFLKFAEQGEVWSHSISVS